MRAAVPDPEHAAALADLDDLRRRARRVRAQIEQATQRTRAGTELPWTGPAATVWREEVVRLVRELEEGESSIDVL
ncbi:MAG: hypothetical protein GX344_13775, partial [Intrasporangiaceae bacterium]|nr:hypothetical protein [Intrasporangiaceae bacterium]